MNQMTSKQRKLVYVFCILVLLAPIIGLGMPSTGPDSGGYLARMRREHELGETTLGNVDPASATMNLVLLGLRGIAVSTLWMQLDEEKNTKDWARMRATTESIILLQPHFVKVWLFHGWNLSYNVSAEWDDVRDRYYWVKEGAKFTMNGSDRNSRSPELYFQIGQITGHKVGRADEWRHFRRFFLSDPDTDRWEGRPDGDLNPNQMDNYLVAREWYIRANDAESQGVRQHIMARYLFRAYPARAQFEYAGALGREGSFEERRRIAWEDALRFWTTEYGTDRFRATGPPYCEVMLEADDNVVAQLVRENNASRQSGWPEVTEADVREWIDSYQKQASYRAWRTRGESEADPNTLRAHRELFNGEELHWAAKLTEALEEMASGMQHFEEMLAKYPALRHDDDTIEEAVRAVLVWQRIHRVLGEPLPETYPLLDIYVEHVDIAPQIEKRLTGPRTKDFELDDDE